MKSVKLNFPTRRTQPLTWLAKGSPPWPWHSLAQQVFPGEEALKVVTPTYSIAEAMPVSRWNTLRRPLPCSQVNVGKKEGLGWLELPKEAT